MAGTERRVIDSAKMKRLLKIDSVKRYELLQKAKQLTGTAAEVHEALESSFLHEQILKVVEGFYDVGRVIDIHEMLGGYINRSFQVVVEQNGVEKEYFLRKYKAGITEKEILLEHKIITHALTNGFRLLPGLVPDKCGNTFVSQPFDKNKFALYHFLKGEDKYTWDNPLMEEGEYQSAAEALAFFHSALIGFEQQDLGRVEPGILELISRFPRSFAAYAEEKRDTGFHDYLNGVLPSLLSVLNEAGISTKDVNRMVVNPIHCDYHPGNLKFSDGKVIGVFDLDWAKVDLRLFDVCLALIYNSVVWGEPNDGNMLADKCALFLKTYQSTLVDNGDFPPLNSVELDNFPTMMAMANFYLLNWEISEYYSCIDSNDREYLAYLKHSVRQMRWIESHKKEFAKVADSVRV